MKMTFLKLFLICTFKDPNLADKFIDLAENLKKKLNSTQFMEFVFSKSAGDPVGDHTYPGSHKTPDVCPAMTRLQVRF